jgi:integrase
MTMALCRRNTSKIWWTRFTPPGGGKRIRKSTETEDRLKAQQFEDQLKAELWRVHKLGDKPRRTWKEAVVRWLREKRHKANHSEDKRLLRILHGYIGERYLDEITRDVVDTLTQRRLNDNVSNATVNRMLQVLRAILRAARDDWEWVDRIPKVRMLPEPKRRVRWITREEADRLLNALPGHIAAMARFTLSTGLRESNVTRLEWSQVDLEARRAWVHADQAKGRRAIAVPLNAEAMVVLREQVGKHPTRVFTFRGRPVSKAGTKTWRAVLRQVGISDFRWHDLRHTWASWHVQNGTPLQALQELGGWESAEMVRRYAHLSPDHLAEHAEKLAQLKAVADVDTKLAQG